jgi:hypothetical protein
MMLTFTLDAALVIQVLVSTVLPLLVGLVTKTVTSGGVKALLLAALALLTSMLTELGTALAAGTTYDVGVGLLLAVPTFLVAVGMHFGIWKPIGAATKAQELFDRNTVVVHEDRVTAPASAHPNVEQIPAGRPSTWDAASGTFQIPRGVTGAPDVEQVADLSSQERYPLHGDN